MRAPQQTLFVAVLLATAIAVPAFAQTGQASLTNYPACTTTPSKQDSEAAHSAFLLGKRFFDEADYGTAVHNFQDAYKLDCTKTELLRILASAFELSGNRAEAIHALETFLQRSPNLGAEDKGQIQKRIDNLRAQLATAGSATATATATAITPPPPTTATAAPTTAPTASTTAPPPPPPPAGGHTVLPWVVAGAGVVIAAVGGVIYLVESSAANNAKNDCAGGIISAAQVGCKPASGVTLSPTQIGNNYNSANGLVPVGSVLFFAGLGVAAGGVIWHFVEPTGAKSDSKAALLPVLVPTVAPGYGGLSLSGRF